MKHKIFLLMFLIIVISSFASATLDDANVYYSFDTFNYTVNNIHDLSGNLNNGTNSGGVLGSSGKLNASVDLTPTDYVTGTSSCGAGLTEFSFNFWVYIDTLDATLRRILSFDDASCDIQVIIDSNTAYTGNGRFYIRLNGGGLVSTDLTALNGLTAGSWKFITIRGKENAQVEIYVDNAFSKSISTAGDTFIDGGTPNFILGCDSSYTFCTDGKIDEFSFYERNITNTEKDELYNGSVGHNPYAVTPTPTGELSFDITAKSIWNNSNTITNFSALINGIYYNTYNGTINTAYNQSQALELNITINASNWFNETVEHNISSNLDQELKQSEIFIQVTELFSGTPINNFSINYSGTIVLNVTGYNGTIYPDINSYDMVVIDNTGAEDFHTTNTTFNVSALDNFTHTFRVHQHYLRVYSKNIINDSDIYNFVVNISSLNISDDRQYTVTNGTAIIPVIHNSYNVTIVSATNYAVFDENGNYYVFNDTITITNDEEITFYLYPYNSINFSFFDTDAILLDGLNISLTLENGDVTNYTTSVGWVFVENLTTGNYTAIYDAFGYAEHQYFFTVTESSTRKIDLFLINATSTLFKFNLRDQNDNAVSMAFIRLQQKINGSFSTINECKTNEDGSCYMYVLESTTIVYREIVVYQANIIKTTPESQIITLSSEDKIITIRVDIGEGLFNEIQRTIGVYGDVTLTTGNISTFDFIDAYNAIVGGCLVIKKRTIPNLNYITLTQSCVSGTSGTININYTPYLTNKSEFIFEGFVNYTDINWFLDTETLYNNPRNVNQSEDDYLLLTLLLFLGVSFVTVWIKNYTLQVFLNTGLLIGLGVMGMNLLGIPIIMSFMTLGIFITWRRKNVTQQI